MANRLKAAFSIFCFVLLFQLIIFPSLHECYAGEIELLKEQIKILQERLYRIEEKQNEAAKLRERIGLVEKKQEEIAGAPKMKAYWKDGFRIEYKDQAKNREYKFRFRTGIQFRYTYVDTDDNIHYNGSPTGKNVDHTENYSSFNMRRLRFYIDGTAPTPDWKYYVHVQLEPQGSVNVHDAFIQWQKYKKYKLTFGRMKIPAYGLEYWQSGFGQNGTDRTIFSGDSEFDKDFLGNRTYDFPGSNARFRVGNHRQSNGFPTGGFLLYRSQGISLNGSFDLPGKKDFFVYWLGVYNGRDTRGTSNDDDQMLYSLRLGINFLSGSDPKGPMGPNAFKNYTAQGDYGYNRKPLAAFVTSAFWDQDKTKTYYTVSGDSLKGFMATISDSHDIENYGFTGTLLFRYSGFSTDMEYAWEEFIQNGAYEESWRRWGVRLNVGYFIVKEKWELVAKSAYVQRIDSNDLEDSIMSGLGLVKLDDGFVVEDNLQQYIVGVNYYLNGFNQYATADLCWYRREFEKVNSRDAIALGLNPADFDCNPDDQNETRFRLMYQFIF